MKRYALWIVCLLAISISWSQECNRTLTGKVIDFHDGISLNDATISFNNIEIITDQEGNYQITGLCPIAYAFTISHEDCNSQVYTIDLSKVSFKDFYLEHHYTDLDKVDLVTRQSGKITNSQNEQNLNREQLATYNSLSIGDALKEISGVTSLTSGNTIVKPVIQGLHSSRIIIMNNGVRQEDQEWGEEHAPNLDINAFNNLKVIKGAGALQYGGNAIGGVIIAQNKLTSVQDTIFGNTQLALSSNGRGSTFNGTVNLGFKKGWASKFQGTIKRYGDSEAPNYVLSNTGIKEQSFSTGFGYSNFAYGFESYYSFYTTTQGILRASHLGNRGDLANAIASSTPLIIRDFTYDISAPKQETQHHLIKLKAYNRFKNLGKLNFQYSYQFNNRQEFDIRRGKNKNKPSLDLDLVTQAIESNFVFDANNNFVKNIGFQYTTQTNTPDAATNVKRLIPDYNKRTLGIFALTEFKINNQVKADAGVRYDYIGLNAKKFYDKRFWDQKGYDQNFKNLIIDDLGDKWLVNPNFDYHSISTSLGLNYRYKDQNELLLNFSYTNRAPNPVELFSDGLHHSAAIIEQGDLRFDQESAIKLSLTSNMVNLFGIGNLSISPFLNLIDNFIFLEPSGRIEFITRGEFAVWEYKQTNALLYGIDINYQKELFKNLQFSTSISYIYGKDKERDRPLINMPAPNFRSQLIYSKEKWDLKLTNTSSLRQNRFPDNNFEDSFINNGALQTRTVDISTPPKGYSLFDISGAYKFGIWNPNDIILRASISNLFNTSYRDYLNRQRFFADNVGRNFILNINFKF